jgi:hypothetical protein
MLNSEVQVGLDGTVTIPDGTEKLELPYEGQNEKAKDVMILACIMSALVGSFLLFNLGKWYGALLSLAANLP